MGFKAFVTQWVIFSYCQIFGCWQVLEDGATVAHILLFKLKNYLRIACSCWSDDFWNNTLVETSVLMPKILEGAGGGRSREGVEHPDCLLEKNCLWACWFWPADSAVSSQTAAGWKGCERWVGSPAILLLLRVRRVFPPEGREERSNRCVESNVRSVVC